MDDTARMVADRLEIAELTYRYARAMDTRDWALMEQVFTPDATANLDDNLFPKDRDEIVATIRGAIEACDVTHHMMSNHEVAVGGDTATLQLQCQAFHGRGQGADQATLEALAHYDADLVRTAEGWRITRWHETCPYYSGDVTAFFGAAIAT